MEMRNRIIAALEHKALHNEQLAEALGIMDDDSELVRNLYTLTQEYLIQKHPIMEGGCKTCACNITYKWRLTLSGRQYLNEKINHNRTEQT